MAKFDVIVKKKVIYVSTLQIEATSKSEAKKIAADININNLSCDEELHDNPEIVVMYSLD